MSFRRRALFLAGLFVAVSCSDAGSPVGPVVGPEPEQNPENVLVALSCSVDVRTGEETCGPPAPEMGDALGAGRIEIGNATQIALTKTNTVSTPDSLAYDRTVQNLIYQALGTTDGLTAHSEGVRVWIGPATINDTTVVGQPASVTVGNADGTLALATGNQGVRPYFQYPGLLQPGATSPVKRWRFNTVNVDAFKYVLYVVAQVQFEKGTLWITPDTPTIKVNDTLTLAAHVRDATKVGRHLTGSKRVDSLSWTSSDTSKVKVVQLTPGDTLAQIIGTGEGTAWVKAQSLNPRADYAKPRVDSVLVTVNNAPTVPLDSIKALENVSVRISATRLRNGLAAGDNVVLNQVIVSDQMGNAVIDADSGGFTYVPKGGFFGLDTVRYNVTDGRWTVQRKLLVKVDSTNYWFVREGGTGDGSNTRPLGGINAAVAAADGNDSIFVLRNGSNNLAGAAALGAGQALIGHGVPAAFVLAATGLNEPARVDSIFQGQGLGTPLTNAGAPTLTLGGNNRVEGVNITSTNAAAIHGVGFGLLTVGSVIVQADGPSLSLSNGTLAGSFMGLHSANSDSIGIRLVNVNGSLTATAASITGAATTAFSVSGGNVQISFPGNITHSGTGRLLEASSHTGGATFQGTLEATAGTGMLLNALDSAYTFNGAVTLASSAPAADVGMDVLNSNGRFTFANATITNQGSGPALEVNGGTPALIYDGSITHNTGRAVAVSGVTADSVVLRATITSGTAAAPTGQGILVQNVSGGRVAFDGAKTLFTSTNPAVTLTNNTGGLVRFGGGTAITTTSGAGFTASGADSVIVTGTNTVSTGTGIPVSLTGVNTGLSGASFSSIVTTAGAANGIVLNGISGAGFQAAGGTISGTTGAAVLLTSTSAADSVSLRGMSLNRAAAGAAVITGTTFGKLHLNTNTASGVPLTVSGSGGAAALSLNGGNLAGLATLTAPNATVTPLSLTNVGGSLTASGGLSVAVGGTGAVVDVNGGTVSLAYTGSVQGLAATPMVYVRNHQTGSLDFNGTNSMTGTGSPGLRFENADGTYNFNTSAGTTALSGDSAGIDILAGTDGANGSQGTFQFGAPGNGFAITSAAGTAFNFQGSAADVIFHGGITKSAAQTGRMVDITGQRSASSITFQTGTLSATSTSVASTGILMNDADGQVSFNGTTALGSAVITTGDAGIDVENNSTGIISFNGSTSVVNAVNELIRIVNSAARFTYSGAFQRTTGNGVGILAQGNSGDTITFNGDGTTFDGDAADVTKSLSTGSGNAISLVSNGGTTFKFAGGMTLATTSGTAFNATGGGTVNVSGAGNTANATAGTASTAAVRITDTDIGAASGVVFRSVSASGGANGIFLQNTGNTGGGFGVTGDGLSNSSGGTIANTTGTDGAAAGNGVYLNTVRNVSLSWMGLSGHANNGLYGTGVRGITLDKVRFTGNNGTSNSGTFNEAAVHLANLGGAVKFSGSRFDGGAMNAVRVDNSSGTAPALDSLVFVNDTVSTIQGSTADVRGSALLVTLMDGTADVRFRDNRVLAWWGTGIHALVQGTSSGTVRITNNFVDNTNGALAGAVGIVAAGCRLGFNISGNTVRHTNGAAISSDMSPGCVNTVQGTIDGNIIGVSGDVNSGTATGVAIGVGGRAGTTTVKITNNVLRQINGSANGAITLVAGDNVLYGGSGALNATISGNNIQETGSTVNSAQHGILVTHGTTSSGANDSHQGCYDILNNTIANLNTASGGAAQNRIRVNQRFGTTSRFPGYTGGQFSTTDLATYLLSRNTASNSTNANTSTGGFNNTVPAGSACPQPSM